MSAFTAPSGHLRLCTHYVYSSAPASHPKCALRRVMRACQNGLPRSSSALNQEDSSNRYVDLRTMQVIRADDAHLCDNANLGATFGILDNPDIFNDPRMAEKLYRLLFTEDTIPLSDSQKEVVRNLLARRSVLYTSAAGDEKEGIFFDIVLRNRLWKERIVFCASSSQGAEAMFAMLCAQLGVERRSEVLLDLGHGSLPETQEGRDALSGVRVVITLPNVLRTNIVSHDVGGWMQEVSVVFMDTFSISTLLDWEEILLSLPSKILLCIFAKELTKSDRELLPLWIETVQNPLVAVGPLGSTSLLDRIERPEGFPLLRTFVYNAARHESPVHVSLTMLKNTYCREIEQADGHFVPDYAEAFLHGITMIRAEDASQLMFRSTEEAEYADICSLVLADAKLAFSKAKSRRGRARASKRKERTASSRAAARRRREAALSHALLFPAIIVVKGREESMAVATAIQSSMDGVAELLWDDDTKGHIEDIVDSHMKQYPEQFSFADEEVLTALKFGVGVLNESSVPYVRGLVQELFRGGLIPLIVCDSHLGSKELNALPCAKSVLMESSCMATCDDQRKGLVMTSTAASLAGRFGKDDVGNLIILWYDESVEDQTAGSEIASTLLNSAFTEEHVTNVRRRLGTSRGHGKTFRSSIKESFMPSTGTYNPLSSSYDGVLRSLRRFGIDGYESIFEYSLSAYQGWLERAALRATLEKLNVDKKAIDERLDEEDWSSIASHERREAKMNEVGRVLKAMESRYETVRSRRLLSELQQSSPGRIIGVKCLKESDSGLIWEPKLLQGTQKKSETNQLSDFENANGRQETDEQLVVTRTETRRSEPMSAAGLVTVIDQNDDGKRIKGVDSRFIVVCILADGMWTMLPLCDVLALTDEEEEVLHNVDLLMMPHPATFDVDPSSGWAKCRPIDLTERDAVHRISDELIAKVAGDDRPGLNVFRIPEYEAQREHVEMAQNSYRQSPWYGRDDEIVELQRLRRRSAKMGDEITWLEKSESELEDELFMKHNTHRSIQSSLLAILEDCHAVSVQGDKFMEMTPLGSLASIYHTHYPVFAAACFSLMDDIEHLTPSQLAYFTGLVACTGRTWKMKNTEDQDNVGNLEDEPLDLSIMHRRSALLEKDNGLDDPKSEANEGDGDSNLLPEHMRQAINEIQQALHQLHRRHLDENHSQDIGLISDIVPTVLDARIAEAASAFADGASWRDIVERVGDDASYVVGELHRIKGILRIVWRNTEIGEFSEKTRELAHVAFDAINRWPLSNDGNVYKLIEEGVIEKRWNGNTYDKWWRSARDDLMKMNGSFETRLGSQIQSVEAEIIESS